MIYENHLSKKFIFIFYREKKYFLVKEKVDLVFK